MSINDEFTIYSKLSDSKNINHHSSNSTTDLKPSLSGSKKKPMSSRKPHIPKDPRNDHRHKGAPTYRKKTHQLSINLRKGSPIKAEVDLFTSGSMMKDQNSDVMNLKKCSKLTDFGKFTTIKYLATFDKDSVYPSELEIENIHPIHSGRKEIGGNLSKIFNEKSMNNLHSHEPL